MDEGGFSNVTAEAFLAFLHIACDKRAEIMYNKITENRIEKIAYMFQMGINRVLR